MNVLQPMLCLEDLRNTRKSLQQAQLENQEELDTPIVDQEITSEQTTTKTAVEPDEDKIA